MRCKSRALHRQKSRILPPIESCLSFLPLSGALEGVSKKGAPDHGRRGKGRRPPVTVQLCVKRGRDLLLLIAGPSAAGLSSCIPVCVRLGLFSPLIGEGEYLATLSKSVPPLTPVALNHLRFNLASISNRSVGLWCHMQQPPGTAISHNCYNSSNVMQGI